MIMSCVPKISSMKTVIKRLDDISNYQDESFLGSEIPTVENCLEISNLNFAYEENKSILNNIEQQDNKLLRIYKEILEKYIVDNHYLVRSKSKKLFNIIDIIENDKN